MSVGSKSSFSVSSLYAREQISTLRATVSAWPVSSNAITTTPAPYCCTRRAFFRKSSSPSFRLMELTTGFPCTHFSPASSTDHFELSIMIGSREDFRLGRDQVEEVRHRLLRVEQPLVHVDVDQVRAAAHLLERHVDRLAELAVLDEPLKFLRAGHVRALADHLEVAVAAHGEHFEAGELRVRRLERRASVGCRNLSRWRSPTTCSAIARM